MSYTFPDEVIVTPVTTDFTTKVQTLGASVTYEASVETVDALKYGKDGKPIFSMASGERGTVIMLPKRAVLKEGYLLQVTKVRGVSVTVNPREIKAIVVQGMLRMMSWEVYLG